jgi:hypothetical protein
MQPTDDKEEETKETVEEINSGLKFEGTSLESMLTLKLDDVEVSSKDIIVVELKDLKIDQFTFYYKPIVILGYGKCEYCYSHKPLTTQCKCKDVKYCGEECQRKDEKFHLDKCKMAY